MADDRRAGPEGRGPPWSPGAPRPDPLRGYPPPSPTRQHRTHSGQGDTLPEPCMYRLRSTPACYPLVGRELEREMIPLLNDQGLGLVVWTPFAGGFLSGKFTREAPDKNVQQARRATFDFPPVNKEKG